MPPSAPFRQRLRALPLRAAIIGVLSLLLATLSACSVIKLGYGQASLLAYRWLDGYVDFDDAQTPRVRAALDDWLAWHRRTQLPDYASVLVRLEAELPADTTPERVCSLAGDVRTRLDAGLERLLPALADIAPMLSTKQIGNIEKHYAEKNAEHRENFMQRDPGKRRKAALKREIERAETLYGSVDEAQRELIVRALANSPYDAETAYAERLLRQQEALALLRKLAAERPARAEATAQIRAYVARLEKSPREPYQRYAERMFEFNCSQASGFHNLTSAAQRRVAAKKLRGYANDLRELAADGAG